MSEAGLEQKYIQEAFDTNWVVPLGPNVNGFEKDLEDFVGQSKRVVALSAGTAAVHLGLIGCGVGPGDEVLVQSFTFCASSHPITYLGATPVFVDSEPDTWNMDPALLEEAIRDRIAKTGKTPKAIVPVALYGMPYRADRIMEIADKYGIPVVEDAAEGFGSRYKGQVLGTFGRYGVLSFNGNKMITTSGGGALITPDEESWREIMMYATQYRESYPYYQHEKIGYNYRMSNICAGIGRGQMTIVNEHIALEGHVAIVAHQDKFALALGQVVYHHANIVVRLLDEHLCLDVRFAKRRIVEKVAYNIAFAIDKFVGNDIASGCALTAETIENLIACNTLHPCQELTRLGVIAVADCHNNLDECVLKNIICQFIIGYHTIYEAKDTVLMTC